jgi:predicted aspartyl protease
MTFIYDTGAQNTIIFDKEDLELLQMEYSREIDIMGADYSVEVTAMIARNMNLSMTENFSGINRDVLVLKEDIVKLREIIGRDVSGLIGANVFRGLIVEIDYKAKKLILHDPLKFNPKRYKSFNKLPLMVKNSKPYIYADASLNNSNADSLLLLLDTGASITLMLQADSTKNINIPENAIVGPLGKGIGGDVEGYIGLIDSISITKELTFRQPLSYFQKFEDSIPQSEIIRNGIIGNSLLERFRIIIDYNNEVLYLKPNKYFNKPFQYDKSGLTIIASGDYLKTFVVSYVIKGSPAEKVDIRPGDIIKQYKRQPKFFLSYNYLVKKLAGKSGKSIKLKIERDGKIITKRFKLEDIFTKKKK